MVYKVNIPFSNDFNKTCINAGTVWHNLIIVCMTDKNYLNHFKT